MRRIKGGNLFASGLTATGFWPGIAVGRILLELVTARVWERVAIPVSRRFQR